MENEICQKILDASSQGNLEQIKDFLKLGNYADCVYQNFTPLKEAIISWNYDIAKYLLENGADVNKIVNLDTNDTYLHTAIGWERDHFSEGLIKEMRTELIELLIEKGADINKENNDGLTPLDWAILQEHNGAKELLRKQGAKNSQKFLKQTYRQFISDKVYFACREKNLEKVREYFELGSSLYTDFVELAHPILHWSIFENQYDIAEYLIKTGIDVNYKNNYLFNFPIHQAIYHAKNRFKANKSNNLETGFIILLLQNNAEINIINDSGQTPLDVAISLKHKPAEELLRSQGAKTAKELEEEKNN